MTDTEIIVLILGGMASCIGAGTVAHISVVQRLARLEAVIEMMGRKAMEQLHSPDDHHGLDVLIDKYLATHDLNEGEWTTIRDTCEEVLRNPDTPHSEKQWALIAFGLSIHKLQRYGVKPHEVP